MVLPFNNFMNKLINFSSCLFGNSLINYLLYGVLTLLQTKNL